MSSHTEPPSVEPDHDTRRLADAENTSAGEGAQRGATHRRLRRRDVLLPLILCAVTFALWAPRLRGPIDLRTDAAVYYVTGVALAEGKGYRLLNEPGDAAAVQYPPLLPAFVAAHRWIVGSSDPQLLGSALRLTYLAISLAYAASLYAMARQFLAPAYSFVVGLVTTLFLQTYFLSNSLFAEIPFALATMLFILCNRRSDRPGYFAATAALGVAAYLLRSAGIAVLAAWIGESVLKRRWRQAIARSAVAIVPIIGWQAYVASVTSSPQYGQPAYEYQRAAYQYYNVPYTENLLLVDSFAPELGRITAGELASRVGQNLMRMPVSMGHSVSTVRGYWEWPLRDARRWLGVPKLPLWVASLPPMALGLMILGGAGVLAARREWFICLYGAATVAVVCLTPWPAQFTRYLTPVTPVLALALVILLATVGEYLRRRTASGLSVGIDDLPQMHSHDATSHDATLSGWRPAKIHDAAGGRFQSVAGAALVVGVVGIVLLIQSYTLLRAYRSGWVLVSADKTRIGGGRLFFYTEQWSAYSDAVEWLRQRVEPGEVVATCTPQWAYVAGGFKAVMPPMEIDRDEAQRLLDTVPVRYAIVDEADVGQVTSRYLMPTIAAHPQAWTVIHTVPGTNTHVYERVR